MANPVVGVLHSAKLNPTVNSGLSAGLSDSGQWVPGTNVTIDERHADGDYGSLVQKATKLQTDNGANLNVVIAAGMVAGTAAMTVWPAATNMPILVVTGRDDNAIFSARANTGGYIFESAALPSVNGQRLSILSNTYQISSNRVCLLYNKNSPMSGGEVTDWTNNCNASLLYNAASATGNPNDTTILPNSQINFAQSIAGAAAKTQATAMAPGAIIVSSDPYFTLNRQAIVLAGAGTSNVFVCYPIFDYLIPKGGKRNTLIFGPLLDEVYFNLGVQAATILTNNAAHQPLPALSMNRATSYYFGRQSAAMSTSALFFQFCASLFK
jgi:hypothetical protein